MKTKRKSKLLFIKRNSQMISQSLIKINQKVKNINRKETEVRTKIQRKSGNGS